MKTTKTQSADWHKEKNQDMKEQFSKEHFWMPNWNKMWNGKFNKANKKLRGKPWQQNDQVEKRLLVLEDMDSENNPEQ